jgi:hypothetical protein
LALHAEHVQIQGYFVFHSCLVIWWWWWWWRIL